jgi:hypothetical protein
MTHLQHYMAQSSYFSALIPYLHHLSEEQVRQLPVTHFREIQEIDMIFRAFHARFLSERPVLLPEQDSISVREQVRNPGNYDQLFERLRRRTAT